jgi:hypothetical protein
MVRQPPRAEELRLGVHGNQVFAAFGAVDQPFHGLMTYSKATNRRRGGDAVGLAAWMRESGIPAFPRSV